MTNTGNAIEECLNSLSNQHGNELKHSRQERYLQIGRSGLFSETISAANTVLDNKYGKFRKKKNNYKKFFLQFGFLILLFVITAAVYLKYF